jgi:ubiquinone/menaquinone biosynthesis C-methylase UbiE
MRPIGALLIAALGLCGANAHAQVAAAANAEYRTKAGREAIAQGLDSPDRDARQHPELLVKRLRLRPGSTVVDLGTGVGYMLPYLSRAVGGSGKVIGEDIHADFLDQARTKAANDKLGNVIFVLGTDRNPHLPPASADLILVLDTYHHFDYPAQMLAGIAKGLRPDGRLAIVDYYKRRGAMGPGDFALHHIRLDAGGVVKEVESNGFVLEWRRDQIPGAQYIAMFRKKR